MIALPWCFVTFYSMKPFNSKCRSSKDASSVESTTITSPPIASMIFSCNPSNSIRIRFKLAMHSSICSLLISSAFRIRSILISLTLPWGPRGADVIPWDLPPCRISRSCEMYRFYACLNRSGSKDQCSNRKWKLLDVAILKQLTFIASRL